MDQIYNSIVAMLQQSVTHPENTPAKSAEKEETSFRDLLDQKKAPADKAPAEEPVETETALKEETELPAEQTVDLEEQLLAAAISAMQMPVVPVAQVEPEQAQPVWVVPFTDQVTGQTEKTPLVPADVRMDVTEKGVQPGVEEGWQAAEGDLTDTATAGDQAEKAADFGSEEVEVLEETTAETTVFRSVKDILVKVGETAGTERGEAVEIPVKDQIGDQIAKALERGEMRLSIRLNPQSLGRVDVELTLTQNGSLQVELRAENQQTQHLLEKETMGLQHLLMRSTQQEVQVQVARHQESQQQAFEDGRQGGHHQNPQQERREERRNAENFLQQLRLGLIPLEAEAS